MPTHTPNRGIQGEGDNASARRTQKDKRRSAESGRGGRKPRRRSTAKPPADGGADPRLDRKLDKSLEATFPASDPVSISPGSD